MPTLSVIVPVYNTDKYLPRCICSILNQSYTDFELILVDDGSTDGSGRICDEYAEKDKRIRVLHKENGGVSSARNVGLDNAKGEWVCFVDSDDEMMLDGLKVMEEGLSGDVALVMAGYKVLDEEGNVVYSIETRISKKITNLIAMKEMFSPADYRYQGYIAGKTFKMSVILTNELRFAEDIFFNEDRLFITQFISSSKKDAFYTTAPVYKYFERVGGAMMSLKKAFNYKLVTDMEAQVRMREIVRLCYDDKELWELADYGVYNSYRMIVVIMRITKAYDVSLSLKLRARLLNIIGRGKLIRYELQRKSRRFINRIKRVYVNG